MIENIFLLQQQYDDAIKAYKAGRPVDFEELPAPPGLYVSIVKTVFAHLNSSILFHILVGFRTTSYINYSHKYCSISFRVSTNTCS